MLNKLLNPKNTKSLKIKVYLHAFIIFKINFEIFGT